MAKATLRKSGEKLITVRFEHHISRMTLIHAVAGELLVGNWPNTRSKALGAYKTSVNYNGMSVIYKWDEGISSDERHIHLSHATRIVDRLFPDFQQ